MELRYKRARSGHKVACEVESNRKGWRWNVKITKGNFTLAIDLDEISNRPNDAGAVVNSPLRTDDQILEGQNEDDVLRLRSIGRLNYQDLDYYMFNQDRRRSAAKIMREEQIRSERQQLVLLSDTSLSKVLNQSVLLNGKGQLLCYHAEKATFE